MLNRLQYYYRYLFWSCEKYARHQGVSIGEGCSIETRAFGSEPFLITIGNKVQITNGVKFFTHGGGWVIRKDVPTFDTFGRIQIKDNVYVGNNVLIMPGITIDSNVIVGAGSVVTKSIPEGCIVAGNPCRIIGYTKDFYVNNASYDLGTKLMTPEQKIQKIKSASPSQLIVKPYLKID